jgi:hypothetical protein
VATTFVAPDDRGASNDHGRILPHSRRVVRVSRSLRLNGVEIMTYENDRAVSTAVILGAEFGLGKGILTTGAMLA